MIKKIDHIGIAVESLSATIPVFAEILGLDFLGTEEVPEQMVKVAKFNVGGVHIELLEPTSPESPIAKFMEKKGQGIHHISYEVDGIEGCIEQLVEKNVAMIDKTPRIGAGGLKIAFIHPKDTAKVLTELCEGHHEH